ncbi:hypothetical protein MMC22_010257 [Lobaria immixta]|nr:hypothetical protein [Lobaria immixta]
MEEEDLLNVAILTRAKGYLASLPGSDLQMNNRSLHRLTRRCISERSKDRLSFKEYAELERILEYRTSLMENADQWLRIAGIEFGSLCHEWNQLSWESQMKKNDRRVDDRYHKIANILSRAELGPDPAEGQGEPWHKHVFFFAAALAEQQVRNLSRELNKLPWIYEPKRQILGSADKIIKRFAERTARSMSPRERARASTGGACQALLCNLLSRTHLL